MAQLNLDYGTFDTVQSTQCQTATRVPLATPPNLPSLPYSLPYTRSALPSPALPCSLHYCQVKVCLVRFATRAQQTLIPRLDRFLGLLSSNATDAHNPDGGEMKVVLSVPNSQ